MIFLENETNIEMDFDYLEIAEAVVNKTLQVLNCPFDCEVNIILTDNNNIHHMNLETRNIDRPTDVLSFPNLFFDEEGIYNITDEELFDIKDPETDLVVLGDIVISLEKVIEQANEYGHSRKREFAFLIAHSMLHLSGFDHMEENEAKRMEEKQRYILEQIGITRDC